jgi:hypothetical protein
MSKRQRFAAYETQYEGAQNTNSENFSDLYTFYTLYTCEFDVQTMAA